MIRRKKKAIEWLEFEQLQEFPELVHGVFLRHGGFSHPPYHSLNLAEDKGDDPQSVEKNRWLISSILGIDHLILSKQVHGDHIKHILGEDSLQNEVCDGLITNTCNLGLLIKHADCQAAIFFDPCKKIIANVHCGWRGNVHNIYSKVVTHFKKHYSSRPEDILVCISPSLGPSRAEFINYQSELPKSFFPFQIKPNHFDFWEISRMQLLKTGILNHHIEMAKLCTFSEEKDFFSHRRDKKTGRNGTVVALKR